MTAETFRVLELGSGVAPAFAGMLLRAAGAEVVRVDWAERFPCDLGEVAAPSPESVREAVMDAWLAGGKRSVCFRAAEAARDHLDALVGLADVVIDGLEPADRAGLGLTPVREPLATHWVAITPFGVDAPEDPGSDLTAVALSGALIAIGRPDREPLTIPHDYASVQGGVIAALTAAAAIIDDGPPRFVDVAIAEVISSYAAINAALFEWRREGHRAAASGGAYPYTILPSHDGPVCLAVRSNAEWRRMLAALGDPSWADDPRFADVREMADRHADDADAALVDTLAGLTHEQLLTRAAELGCAIAPVRGFDDLSEDDELRMAGVVRSAEVAGDVAAVPFPAWLVDAAGDDRELLLPPEPGADNLLVSEWLAAIGAHVEPDALWTPTEAAAT